MTTRADVDRLTAAQRRIVTLARADLEEFFASLNLASPEAAREALLEYAPILVAEYGEASAAVAAEWYEEVRAREVGGRYTARVGGLTPDDAVRGGVRYAAGHLWTESPELTIAVLSGAIQRYIAYGGRDAVARNVATDPARPRYARVPAGRTTCAFCTMLASRGFVYHSEADAQRRGRNQTQDKYHDDCDCQVVMSWDRDRPHIEGYDPDAMYEMYLAARGDDHFATDEILARMRDLYGLA